MITIPFFHPGLRVWGPTIHGNEFLRASPDPTVIYREALQFELQQLRSVSNLETDTYSTTRVFPTVQQLLSSCIWKEITINSSTMFVEQKLTSPILTCHLTTEYAKFNPTPTYSRPLKHRPTSIMSWGLVFHREMKIFRFICAAEVNISVGKHLEFCYKHWHTCAYAPTHSTTRASITIQQIMRTCV
jgi:hypothetical protein